MDDLGTSPTGTEVENDSKVVLESAFYLHSHIYENIKFVEALNAVVLGLSGGMVGILVGGLVPWFGQVGPQWFPRILYLVGMSGLCGCALLSVWYSLRSLIPLKLKSPDPSLFFFGTLEELGAEKAASELLDRTNAQMVKALVDHSCTLAGIVAYKYRCYSRSLSILRLSMAFILPVLISIAI